MYYILAGIGILPKYMLYLLIYKGGDQVIIPIAQYLIILAGIGILPKYMFYWLIYKGGDQIIIPIPQYLY
jgi:hypothetical protein